jgi:hypothetical protein
VHYIPAFMEEIATAIAQTLVTRAPCSVALAIPVKAGEEWRVRRHSDTLGRA